MTDEDNCLSLVRNPAPEKAKARANWGHTADSGICGLTFLCDDQHLVSVGSACIFVWRCAQNTTVENGLGITSNVLQSREQGGSGGWGVVVTDRVDGWNLLNMLHSVFLSFEGVLNRRFKT